MPQAIFERSLLGGHLGADVKVLQLASAANTEMPTLRHHALGALTAQCRHRRLLPVVLFAVNLHLHRFAGQGTFDEDHFAFAVVGHALAFEVERLDLQPLTWRRHSGCLSVAFNASQRGGNSLTGSTGLPILRSSKCSCTRSESLEPMSAIRWPFFTIWSSLTNRVWLCAYAVR